MSDRLPRYRLALFFVLITAVFFSAPLSPARVQAAHAARPTVSAIIALARSLIGAPYAYIGDDPRTGFSCIGFVHYIYGRSGIDVPYDLHQAYNAAPHIARNRLQAGDLVFFSNTVWNGLSHVALYIGDDQIIGADNFTTGVELTHLSDHYWTSHYTGATRPLAGTTGTPSLPVPALPPPPIVHPGDLLRSGNAGDIYSGPGYLYPHIDHLGPHTLLRVAQIQGAWANVVYSAQGTDLYGWVDAPYLSRCAILTAHPRPR